MCVVLLFALFALRGCCRLFVYETSCLFMLGVCCFVVCVVRVPLLLLLEFCLFVMVCLYMMDACCFAVCVVRVALLLLLFWLSFWMFYVFNVLFVLFVLRCCCVLVYDV